ncbi:MAG: hypothetical protein IPJ14_10425 [Kineosporiaceae bacterium]|nr:hypothetical protein [Kineosporiaceae bacterium]
MREVIAEFTENRDWWRVAETLGSRLDSAFDFVRYWVEHGLPVRIRAVDRIVQEVFPARGIPSGSYLPYAARMEAGFLPPLFLSMEE